LGALTGEVIESHVDMQIDQSYSDDVATDIVTEEDVNYEDSGVIDMGEITFDDSGALDSGEVMLSGPQEADIDLDLGETTEFEAPEGVEPLSQEESVSDLDLDSLGDSSEMMIDIGDAETGEEEEISLDLEELSEEAPAEEEMPPFESTEDDESEVSFDFDDLALDESDSTDEPQIQEPEEESEEPGIDFDAVALEEPEPMDEPQIQEPEEKGEEPGIDFDAMSLEDETEESEEIELGLDDLQIDEDGELEIRMDSESAESSTEDLLDLENIDMELDDLDDESK
jgi:hypothetical protein